MIERVIIEKRNDPLLKRPVYVLMVGNKMYTHLKLEDTLFTTAMLFEGDEEKPQTHTPMRKATGDRPREGWKPWVWENLLEDAGQTAEDLTRKAKNEGYSPGRSTIGSVLCLLKRKKVVKIQGKLHQAALWRRTVAPTPKSS